MRSEPEKPVQRSVSAVKSTKSDEGAAVRTEVKRDESADRGRTVGQVKTRNVGAIVGAQRDSRTERRERKADTPASESRYGEVAPTATPAPSRDIKAGLDRSGDGTRDTDKPANLRERSAISRDGTVGERVGRETDGRRWISDGSSRDVSRDRGTFENVLHQRESKKIDTSRTRMEQDIRVFGGGSRQYDGHGDGRTILHRDYGSPRRSSIVYHDRPNYYFGRRYHHDYWFSDYYHRLCYVRVWPSYCFGVWYNWGPYWSLSYVHPYYHRKYVFVSLGGWWPTNYRYVRYYTYSYHPYDWYGYCPVPQVVGGDTYNYYTYNYYGADDSADTVTYDGAYSDIPDINSSTYAHLREKTAQEPEPETVVDVYFDEAVKAFEVGDYETAVAKFGEAAALAPDDIVLPFAYSQSLMASGRYMEAAVVLRAGVEVMSEEEGVFYPRGLYADDEVLFDQIEQLGKLAAADPYNVHMQLLLGYQLLGVGELDEAEAHLRQAMLDSENINAAQKLLNLLEKMRTNDEL